MLGAGDDRSLASIYAVLAALLHMGNMVFEATDTPDTSRVKVRCAHLTAGHRQARHLPVLYSLLFTLHSFSCLRFLSRLFIV